MVLLVILFVCGVALTLSMSLFPAWNAAVEKHILKLIDAIGILMLSGFWLLLAYGLLAWLGLVDAPSWLL
jgi:hypothetical protein